MHFILPADTFVLLSRIYHAKFLFHMIMNNRKSGEERSPPPFLDTRWWKIKIRVQSSHAYA